METENSLPCWEKKHYWTPPGNKPAQTTLHFLFHAV